MKFQQPKNDPSNREDKGRSELKNVIIEKWLGIRYGNITIYIIICGAFYV